MPLDAYGPRGTCGKSNAKFASTWPAVPRCSSALSRRAQEVAGGHGSINFCTGRVFFVKTPLRVWPPCCWKRCCREPGKAAAERDEGPPRGGGRRGSPGRRRGAGRRVPAPAAPHRALAKPPLPVPQPRALPRLGAAAPAATAVLAGRGGRTPLRGAKGRAAARGGARGPAGGRGGLPRPGRRCRGWAPTAARPRCRLPGAGAVASRAASAVARRRMARGAPGPVPSLSAELPPSSPPRPLASSPPGPPFSPCLSSPPLSPPFFPLSSFPPYFSALPTALPPVQLSSSFSRLLSLSFLPTALRPVGWH